MVPHPPSHAYLQAVLNTAQSEPFQTWVLLPLLYSDPCSDLLHHSEEKPESAPLRSRPWSISQLILTHLPGLSGPHLPQPRCALNLSWMLPPLSLCAMSSLFLGVSPQASAQLILLTGLCSNPTPSVRLFLTLQPSAPCLSLPALFSLQYSEASGTLCIYSCGCLLILSTRMSEEKDFVLYTTISQNLG